MWLAEKLDWKGLREKNLGELVTNPMGYETDRKTGRKVKNRRD
jgi:hypothetical protein